MSCVPLVERSASAADGGPNVFRRFLTMSARMGPAARTHRRSKAFSVTKVSKKAPAQAGSVLQGKTQKSALLLFHIKRAVVLRFSGIQLRIGPPMHFQVEILSMCCSRSRQSSCKVRSAASAYFQFCSIRVGFIASYCVCESVSFFRLSSSVV